MIQLLKSQSATFDSNGEAVITFINGGIRRWHITLMNTQTTSGRPKATVHKGEVSPNTQVDRSQDASADTSPCDIWINPGERLSVKYTNGITSSVATYRIEGEER